MKLLRTRDLSSRRPYSCERTPEAPSSSVRSLESHVPSKRRQSVPRSSITYHTSLDAPVRQSRLSSAGASTTPIRLATSLGANASLAEGVCSTAGGWLPADVDRNVHRCDDF